MSTNHDVSKIDDLIVTLIDSIKGYDQAAEHAKAPEHASFFAEMAADRRSAVATLQEESRRLGGTPADYGSAAATIHRRIEDLRRALGGGDAAILTEVAHGEDYLAEEFGRVLGDGRMSAEPLAVVRRCHVSVERGRDGVSRLREELKAAA